MAQPIWTTPQGSIGTIPSLIATTYQLVATEVSPATSLTYTIISGGLPNGLIMNTFGLIFGTPNAVIEDTTYTFVVRATDNLDNIRDRTFSLTVSGVDLPYIITSAGDIYSGVDSVWFEFQIEYFNPIATNPAVLTVSQGNLPPGLEMNEKGMIRGYPLPPIITQNLPEVTTNATITTDTSNYITVFTTSEFTVGRPIIFTGTVFGGVVSGVTYYIKEIVNSTQFTIAQTINGSTYLLGTDTGYMNVTLPSVDIGSPAVQTFPFSVTLDTPLGDDTVSYVITIANHTAPISAGGPGYLANTRTPTIYNTRPQTFDIEDLTTYRYYLLPNDTGITYLPAQTAIMGQFTSGNYFTFPILGHDFDGDELTYVFVGLPSGLTGDSATGWITGYPNIASESISDFVFSVYVQKTSNTAIKSPTITFGYRLTNGILGEIIWITDNDLGSLYNGETSTLFVEAISDVDLQYNLTSGTLPPNLTLLSNGQLAGRVAEQPGTEYNSLNDTNTFNFTIEAYSANFPILYSTKSFTVTINQEINQPTDILYMKATPSIDDRIILDTLLNNTTLIPNEALYRAEDPNFGKATSIIYAHAYGIHSNYLDDYLAAVQTNHYWRNITLGEIKTAVARDEIGNIIYEVVYSEIIDDLVNPQGVSIPELIVWPRKIDLGLGPWYTSITSFYTSSTSLYVSLTPGYAKTLYPNSLLNMRKKVGQFLGYNDNTKLLPKWMTSQQINGSTLGYIPAWVICYTKPGLASTVQNNIQNNWLDINNRKIALNQINFTIDRFSVDKSATYNYDTKLDPPNWLAYPSGNPVPNPINSKDFYVIFPRKTILPDTPQLY